MDKKLTNKAWEPKVGERYWFIQNFIDGRFQAVSTIFTGTRRDVGVYPYECHKRDNNVFRTRAQARRVLSMIKFVLYTMMDNADGLSQASMHESQKNGGGILEITFPAKKGKRDE